MVGSDSEFANFTLPTLKAILEARSQNCPATSNNLLLVQQEAPKRIFFHELAIFSSAKKWHKDTFFPTLHPLSPVIFACNSGGICIASQF